MSIPSRSNRENDQPLPTKNQSRDIQFLLVADVYDRRELGIRRYGTALQANNGRCALVDAYFEALDLATYLRQAIEEDPEALRVLKELRPT